MATSLAMGALPWKGSYTRAQRLGDGACGAVTVVYDEDGGVYAMKTFEADEEDQTLALETLRELAMLRMMHGANAHPNIVDMTDLTMVPNDESGEDELCMVMPKFACDLKGAMGEAMDLAQKGLKLRILHGLLKVHMCVCVCVCVCVRVCV